MRRPGSLLIADHAPTRLGIRMALDGLGEGYELAENVEGDVTLYSFASREERDRATDELAFFTGVTRAKSGCKASTLTRTCRGGSVVGKAGSGGVSSANFTYASRRSAEFGYWTEDADLLRGVAQFLANLIGASEDLDSAADALDPELADVEYDDEAMGEAAAESYQARVELAELRDEEFEDQDW